MRWVIGGWQAVIHRLEHRARELGVRIELGSRVAELPSHPTIVATELASARMLLGDESLRWESGHCVMLDLPVVDGRADFFITWDLDSGGFHESSSVQDHAVAPAGESLFQIDLPVRSGESVASAPLAVGTVPGWRDRVTWQRSGTAKGRTGALDLPGSSWQDRTAIERGGDVFLAGDMVAAPGMRGEISINSAIRAAQGAIVAATAVPR